MSCYASSGCVFEVIMKEWAQWALVNESEGMIEGEGVGDVKIRSGVAEHL